MKTPEVQMVMTDVPDAQLESVVRVMVESQYETILIEVQDRKKRSFKVTAD